MDEESQVDSQKKAGKREDQPEMVVVRGQEGLMGSNDFDGLI